MPRKPPAFQCYAANILTDKNFRKMSLSERGLFFTMYLESWANEKLPTNSEELAKYLGLNHEQIKTNLSQYVIAFFTTLDGEYVCPELEDYRHSLELRRQKQSTGGTDGAKRKKIKQQNQSKIEGQPISQPEGSLVQTKTNQNNSKSYVKEKLPDDINKWVKDFSEEKTFGEVYRGR
jgi:uncharacterized protein YdaU (DUF1376 family)